MALERRAGRFLDADSAGTESGASDRGVQYASGDYPDLLQANGIDIRMSRKGNPWDWAAWESFMQTLKYEEVYRTEYRNLAQARRHRRVLGETCAMRSACTRHWITVRRAQFESTLALQAAARIWA
jgi:transposase InsO family protein